MTPAELFEAFADASVRRDPVAFLDLFTEEGELVLPFADLAYRGREAIRERIAEQWKSSPIRVREFADHAVCIDCGFPLCHRRLTLGACR